MTDAETIAAEPLRRLLQPLTGTIPRETVAPLESRAAAVLTEAWRQAGPPAALSPRQLDLFYRLKPLVPRTVQLALRRALVRRQGLPAFPSWPFDPTIADLLDAYAAALVEASGGPVEFRWFWPRGSSAAAILTHDVESAEGLRLAVELADLEEGRGLYSSFNVVADWYPLDHGILDDLRSRGFEIGVHGIHHDRSLFASRASFEAGLPRIRSAAERFQATGFRSPATHRVVEWLPELPVDYDCTMPHSDPYEPQPGGCCSLWPFFLGRLVELPYTLPQDHTMFTLLRHRTIDLWLGQVDEIVARHGLVQAVTHPDPGYLGDLEKRALYAELLDALRDRDKLWHALPRDVASWWRARDAGSGGSWDVATATASVTDRRVALTPAT